MIAHFGDPELARAVVGDLARQDWAGSIEVIVADDCSPFAYQPSGSERVVRTPVNSGFGAAINTGAAHASQSWLLILNSDLRLEPDFISGLMKAVEGRPSAVFGVTQFGADGSEPPMLRPFPGTTSLLLQESAIASHLGWRPSPAVAGNAWLAGSLLLMRTEAFRQAAGFDERFFMYSEEVDLQRRLRDLGYPAVLLAELTAMHQGARSTGDLDVGVEMLRSRLAYVRKHSGAFASTGYANALAVAIVADAACETFRSRLGRPTFPRGTAALRLRILAAALKPRVR